MAANPQSLEGEAAAAFELKAAGFTLPIFRLLGDDMEAVANQLSAKVGQAPDFFRNTPIVIDLGDFAGGEVEFPLLVGLLRGYGMIPFGVRGGSKAQHASAETMELAVLGESYSRAARAGSANAEGAEHAAAEEPARASMLVARPVRSGQRHYAAGGDLSVVGAVSSGAELMADGNIHVYGPLRGRAMAGVNGDLEARIFCQDLQAELVAIAGHYRVSENIPAELQGVPVQIFLDQKILRIEKL
ncbi:septum site-determining protein MinC [Marichromatium purpuratum 984]|uniref:Probable septum site-determining protein MinC n=1 Tax=Marichromatium purpuratum 984 TaxID=765910 RepID=W0DXX5_MARPU|nr:septum site-determining protein MinC [Marichromatium purpuratum]AHF03292.1 septum site-determining protein MinC [Marichromatium purpuratum 984]